MPLLVTLVPMTYTPGDDQPHNQPPYPTDPPQSQTPGPQAYPSAAPAYPVDGGAPHGPVTPPPQVSLAVKLMYAFAALSLVSLLLTFTQTDAIREQVESQPGMTPAAVDAAVTIGLAVGVIFGVIGIALWLLCAVFNAKGKKWARIVATVLAALVVISFVFSLASTSTTLMMVVGFIQLALAVAILWFLWRPESSRFYQAANAPRY